MNIYTIVSALLFLAALISFKFSLFLALVLVVAGIFIYLFAARLVDMVMEDRWVAMKVFSCVEVLAGGAGFAALVFFLAKAFGDRHELSSGGTGLLSFLVVLFIFGFSLFFLYGGVGVFRRKAWALKMHTWGVPFLVLFFALLVLAVNVVGIGFAFKEGLAEKWIYFCSVVIILNLVVTVRLLMHLFKFFRDPMVKLYFRK